MTQKRKIQTKIPVKIKPKAHRRLSITVCKTVNLGDYNSLKIQCGLEQDISESVSLETAYQDMFDEVGKEVMELITQSTEG